MTEALRVAKASAQSTDLILLHLSATFGTVNHDIFRKGKFLLWLMKQSVFIPINGSYEERGTYSGFSGAGLNHKHLQL